MFFCLRGGGRGEAGLLHDPVLSAGGAAQLGWIPGQKKPHPVAAIFQMAGTADPSAAVPSRSCQHNDLCLRVLNVLDGVPLHVTARIFHHLEHSQAEVFHGNAIHLSHLLFGQGRQDDPPFGHEGYLLSQTSAPRRLPRTAPSAYPMYLPPGAFIPPAQPVP